MTALLKRDFWNVRKARAYELDVLISFVVDLHDGTDCEEVHSNEYVDYFPENRHIVANVALSICNVKWHQEDLQQYEEESKYL